MTGARKFLNGGDSGDSRVGFFLGLLGGGHDLLLDIPGDLLVMA